MNGNLRQKARRAERAERARCISEELSIRLDTVETWLASRYSRGEILALARKNWGVSTRQADRYLAQATSRWAARVEPEREQCRRRNLATIDVAIAMVFREQRLRDLAGLVRLRALLDGSLNTSPTPVVPEEEPVALPELLRSVAELIRTVIDSDGCDDATRRDLAGVVAGLADVVRDRAPMV